MKTIQAADRTKNVQYAIRDIATIAKQVEKDKKVIYLNIGDPNRFDFDTPLELKQSVITAIKKGHNYYAFSQGIREAVKAIVKHNNKLGIETDEAKTMVTSGVSEAVQICVASLVNKGENMVIPRPSYPIYTAYLNLFECEPRFYTLQADKEWKLDIEDIEDKINRKTKALLLINPNNPTGGVYTRKELEEVVNIAAQNDLIIISDEIYDDMILEGEMSHIASFSKEVPVITFNGLAKNFLAPGWRTGWLSVTDREQKMESVTNAIMQLGRARICSTTPQQFAIKTALEGKRKHKKDVINKLRKRRDLTCKRINEIQGLSLQKPRAAFYAFPKLEFKINDKEFVIDLLKKEGVATVYGSGFDMPGFFRLVYLPEEKILNEAFDRIEKYIKTFILIHSHV